MGRNKFCLKNYVCMCIGLFIALTTQVMAQPFPGDTGIDPGKIVLTGWGSSETGQIYNMNYSSLTPTVGLDVPRQWLMRQQVNLTGKYVCNEYFRASVGITGRMWYDEYPVEFRQPNGTDPLTPYFTVYPSVVEGVFSYNRWNKVKLGLEVGYFPFQYDSCCRNLGEYLIRSGTYPPYLVTTLDQTFIRVAGLHANVTLYDMVHLHALLTQESEMPPFFDPSLTFLGDVNIKKVFVIGGGVMFANFLPVDNAATESQSGTNAYVDPSLPDSTGHYTMEGTKIMARASFDPKPLFKSFSDRFLGRNDLEIYGEVAMLGVKDYPGYYNNLNNRIPRMVGFNVPTFKALDVLALEFEFNPWVYVNGYLNPVMYETAIPESDYANNKWRWTAYAKRSLFGHCSILLMCARDHLVLPTAVVTESSLQDICAWSGSWYWDLKFQVTL